MTEFTASNGLQINRYGSLCGQAPDLATAGDIHLARSEFYQHLRDTALERWRWPLYPEYVVYSGRRPILVLNELTGDTFRARRDDEFKDNREGTIYAASLAYFDAHPEQKPWRDAKIGEVWVLSTADGETAAYSVMTVRESGVVFEGHDGRYAFVDPDIESARRIWPEDAS